MIKRQSLLFLLSSAFLTEGEGVHHTFPTHTHLPPDDVDDTPLLIIKGKRKCILPASFYLFFLMKIMKARDEITDSKTLRITLSSDLF